MQKAIVFLIVLLLILCFKSINCTIQNKSLPATKFRLLTYGKPDFEKQNSIKVIGDKWGIEFYPVAACEVTWWLKYNVEQQNDKVESLIETKYGKNWSVKFYKEVDNEYKIEKIVDSLIDRQDYITKKEVELKKEGNGLRYTMIPISNSTIYNVLVQGWGKWQSKDEWLTYYKLIVDYRLRIVKLVSDKVVKE